MKDAVFISPCQHGACKACLTVAIKCCPVCREDINGAKRSKIIDDRRTREIIDNLLFKCQVKDCVEIFRLCEREKEVNTKTKYLALKWKTY